MTRRHTSLAAAEIHRRLLEVHLETLERQTAAQRSFLEASARVEELLRAAAGGEAPRVALPSPAPVDSPPSPPTAAAPTWPERVEPFTLTLEEHPWIADHTAAWTVPVLPLTYMVDMLCRAALEAVPGRPLARVVSVDARAWVGLSEGECRGRTRVKAGSGERVEVELWVEDPEAEGGSRISATARVELGEPPRPPDPASIPGLEGGVPVPCPYEAGALFHGPSLQLMTDLVRGENGARARVDATSRGVPYGLVHPGMLDACLHAVPFLEVARWYPERGAGRVAFPCRLRDAVFHRPLPHSGTVDVEVRKLRIEHGALPVLGFWVSDAEGLLARFELTIVLLPQGPMEDLELRSWRRFLSGEGAVSGASLGRPEGEGWVYEEERVRALDWLPGSIARVYGVDRSAPDALEQMAARDHLGRLLSVHPSRLVLEPDGRCANVPWNATRVVTDADAGRVRTRVEGPEPLSLEPWLRHWLDLGMEHNLVVDLSLALARRFVRRVVLEAPDERTRLAGRPILYLTNHQTAIESVLFCFGAVVLGDAPCHGLTRRENHVGLLRALDGLRSLVPGKVPPLKMLPFDTGEPGALQRVLEEYRRTVDEVGASLYVAVEGQRATRADHEVTQLSSVFLDLAVDADLPIVPAKLVGGLPREPAARTLDLPYGMGSQDYVVGRALMPEALAGLPYAERRRRVLARLNALGPEPSAEGPNPPDPAFASRVAARRESGLGEMGAVLVEALRELDAPCEQTGIFLDMVDGRAGASAALRNPMIRALVGMLRMSGA